MAANHKFMVGNTGTIDVQEATYEGTVTDHIDGSGFFGFTAEGETDAVYFSVSQITAHTLAEPEE